MMVLVLAYLGNGIRGSAGSDDNHPLLYILYSTSLDRTRWQVVTSGQHLRVGGGIDALIETVGKLGIVVLFRVWRLGALCLLDDDE